MTKVDYLILGAGPAGLTAANCLLDAGIDSFLVLEKEKRAGGLCRSQIVDDAPLDIGGGHILDVRRAKVLEYLFRFMPLEEWNHYDRISKIQAIGGQEIDYPYEANIWQLPIEKQVEHIMSIANAGCYRGVKMPEQFEEWIVWKLGEKIAEDYMFPYNRKIWSIDLKELGTYWMEKLPDVSLKDTLYSCLQKKAYGVLPAHARFYYPKKYGFGELWIRMAERIREHMVYEEVVTDLDANHRIVNGRYQGNRVISTIPWDSIEELKGAPEEIRKDIASLEHSAVVIEYQQGSVETNAHWTYYPDEKIPYHRILWRSNFCAGSKGYWTETNARRYVKQEKRFSYYNEYAYPLNTVKKPATIKRILNWAATHRINGLGRFGEWEHLNTDVTVEHAMDLIRTLRMSEDSEFNRRIVQGRS